MYATNGIPDRKPSRSLRDQGRQVGIDIQCLYYNYPIQQQQQPTSSNYRACN